MLSITKRAFGEEHIEHVETAPSVKKELQHAVYMLSMFKMLKAFGGCSSLWISQSTENTLSLW